MGMDNIDNLAIALVALIGIYYHSRILIRNRLGPTRTGIKISCIIALTIALVANLSLIFRWLPSSEIQLLFTLSNWITIPSLVALGMSDYGRYVLAK